MRCLQCGNNLRKSYIAHHEKIDIAGLAMFSAGKRTIYECDLNSFPQYSQCAAKRIRNASRLQNQLSQFREDGGFLIRLVIDLVPLLCSYQNSGPCQMSKFSLHPTQSGTNEPHDLAHVKGLVRVSKEKR